VSYLVDPNVFREPVKPKPDARVIAWCEKSESSSLNRQEAVYGAERLLPRGVPRRRTVEGAVKEGLVPAGLSLAKPRS